jgi:hypothetical protein
MVLAGLGVILGVWIEGHWGTKADQDADQIRDIQQAHIRNAEERLADTTERIAKILVNAGPPRLLGDQKGFWELKQFAGTPFLVQGLPTPYRHPDEDDATFQARYDVFEGSIHGVLSFQQLIIVGWVALPLVTWRCSWMPEQVVIFSRHGNPLEVRLDTPEAKAWSAAEALTQYMRSTGLDAVEHLPIRDDASGNPTDQLAGLILPRNGIFIMVGGKNSNEAIELLEHDLEVRPDG